MFDSGDSTNVRARKYSDRSRTANKPAEFVSCFYYGRAPGVLFHRVRNRSPSDACAHGGGKWGDG